MAAHRREHLAHNVRFLAYTAFKVRQQYGRRPVVYRWHFKKVPLNWETLGKAIANISKYQIVDKPTHIYFG